MIDINQVKRGKLMKIFKRISFLLICCSLLAILALFISQIYAKYRTAVSGRAEIAISRWDIKLNGASIKNNQDISSKITPVFPGNENIASNVIAPTAEGYFDLNLDYTNVDVSFKYEISIETSQESAVSDLVITGYSINGGDKITVSDFSTPLTDTISLSDAVRTRSMRIFIMWNDDPDTSSMNNIDDTSSTLQATNSAILNVKIALTQVV